MSEFSDCRFVEEYLDRFAAAKRELDHDAISDHVKLCSSCYERMAQFFRMLEVPESEYLAETIDDLTLSIYNLAKSIMRQPTSEQEDEASHENVLFVTQPEAPSHYVEEGAEIASEVQDYTGQDDVRGESMEHVREIMERPRHEVDFLLHLLDRGIALGGCYSNDCRNLKGILLLSEGEKEAAEKELRAVIAAPNADLYLRSVQVHAMNNLSWICSDRGDVNEAIKWATRSRVLAEECDLDQFSSRFALMFFYLQRNADGDGRAASAEVEAILASDTGRKEFMRCMTLAANAEIKQLFLARGLDERFPFCAE